MVKVAHWQIWLRQCDKSAVVEDRLNYDPHIQLQDTKTLSIKPGYMDWLITEATEMELQHTNMNDGILLSRSRKPLIRAFRKQRRPPSPSQRTINMLTALFRISTPIVFPCKPSLPKFPDGYFMVLGMTQPTSPTHLTPLPQRV
jgi:hypothetical protein